MDPDNRLLARGPRFRLPAESTRDRALAVAGILGTKMHGPPVKPPQPSLGSARRVDRQCYTRFTRRGHDAGNRPCRGPRQARFPGFS
ncbi:MAG: DUF1553 domain-containing protein [Planctomycetes bacterium]|nr:DUF1553 domain-containing protein [Planctomycetota bacterium]